MERKVVTTPVGVTFPAQVVFGHRERVVRPEVGVTNEGVQRWRPTGRVTALWA
ncbi:hypothetical protein ACFYOT_20175 [Saccharothrix saharensis]|uniref:hypothetical protein n=1 Tax=Saccharothrix saharensis TaxID=571190 RepID=UPI0036C4232A